MPTPTFRSSASPTLRTGSLLAATLFASSLAACAITTDDPDPSEPSTPTTPGDPTAPTTPTTPTTLVTGCFGTVGGEVVQLDLEHETITSTGHTLAGADLSSLGLVEKHLVACVRDDSSDGAVVVLDLESGQRTTTAVACDAVTALDGRVYVLSFLDGLREYANLGALASGTVSRHLGRPAASRLGAGDGRLLAAWHSDSKVAAIDVATGTAQDIALPGYDGWIYGLAEDPQHRLVAGGWVETGINVYKRGSGELVDRRFDGVFIEGLACAPTAPGGPID